MGYLARRPLTLVRHDKGRVFFHTSVIPPTLIQVHRLTVRKRKGGEGTRLWVDSVPGSVALVDAGVTELPPWCSTIDDLEHPDVMILDLDPGEGIDWKFVRVTALALRDFLKREEGLGSWPKGTGGKGLHIMIPLDGTRDHDEARNYARRIAAAFGKSDRSYTLASGAANRRGKLFIDYLRNGRGQTGVGAFSLRARPGFPVAIPLTWKQVENGQRSDAVGIEDLLG
jgi:bifunctional non-homologous end joining protein LigD